MPGRERAVIFSSHTVPRGARTVWIEPFPSPFSKSLEDFRLAVFAQHQFIKGARDLAVVLECDTDEENETLSVSFGPMWPEQLKERYLREFGSDSYAESFLLVDIDLSRRGTSGYSSQAFGRFIRRAIETGEQYAASCIRMVFERSQ